MTVEQMCRALLERAIEDELIPDPAENALYSCPDQLTGGELIGMANLLADFLRFETAKREARWQEAVGMSLESAEELARSEKNRSAEVEDGQG